MKQKGFTLIEMLVVMCLIGMSAAITLPALAYKIQRGKQLQTLDQMQILKTGLDEYWAKHCHTLPADLSGLKGDTVLGIPSDGWGRAFGYTKNSETSYELWSLGSDGVVETHAAAITSTWGSDIVVKDSVFVRYPQGTQHE